MRLSIHDLPRTSLLPSALMVLLAPVPLAAEVTLTTQGLEQPLAWGNPLQFEAKVEGGTGMFGLFALVRVAGQPYAFFHHPVRAGRAANIQEPLDWKPGLFAQAGPGSSIEIDFWVDVPAKTNSVTRRLNDSTHLDALGRPMFSKESLEILAAWKAKAKATVRVAMLQAPPAPEPEAKARVKRRRQAEEEQVPKRGRIAPGAPAPHISQAWDDPQDEADQEVAELLVGHWHPVLAGGVPVETKTGLSWAFPPPSALPPVPAPPAAGAEETKAAPEHDGPPMRDLVVSGAEWTDSRLASELQGNPGIRAVRLGAAPGLTSKGIVDALADLKNLEGLTIDNGSVLEARDVAAIAKSHERLHTLKVRNLGLKTWVLANLPMGMRRIHNAVGIVIDRDFSRFTNLKELTVVRSDTFQGAALPGSLTHLSVGGCGRFTCGTLPSGLMSLRIHGCEGVTPRALAEALPGLPSLTRLELIDTSMAADSPALEPLFSQIRALGRTMDVTIGTSTNECTLLRYARVPSSLPSLPSSYGGGR